MARHNAVPPGDYFADSESSDLYELDDYHHPPTPMSMKRTTFKPTKSRHVTVRTPSEEDLFERTFETGHRRTPTPYALVRQSSSDEEENHKTTKAHKQRKSVAENVTGPPGVAPYNAPAGTTVQNGNNQVYLHGYATQPGCLPGQQTINTPYPYAINYPGQPAPFIIANPAIMDGYQNSAPQNNGLNFQPQVPDTSLGPMTHIYRPSYDGGVVYAQPGIAPNRPITFAPAPLVAAPVATPAVVVYPTFVASAPVYTTLGYKGDDGVVAPREVVAGPQGVAVPIQAGPATAPIMPVMAQQPYQQPYQQQPMMVAGGVQTGQPVMMAAPGGFGGGGVPPGQPVLVNGGPAPVMGGQPAFMMPGNNTFPPMHNEPATGIGETAGQVASAYMSNPELNEPQDFKPADENPSRMYMVRQLDGQYIQMPRITIDSFGKGARWYATDDGVFYAVRLET
ncbi:hypothetical protein VMCG_06649 [Cytospora schulzeri]|uniref:Uncharacterized protein n=1 Tax=Cytospora schulzeri TaxID=448051 RepID=A0A423W6W1_9PEZI|nr:hypothetical protein VMCG_06649 [Valsa malicola]